MASSYKDANPNAEASKAGGEKNEDGRLKGGEYSSAKSETAGFDPKHTFDPNDGAPKLGQRPGAE